MAADQVDCCIVGGGPAGMMLGMLLGRAGINVMVLEKHGDFIRDFRGDTIHPSTLEVMHELGLLPEFLRLPHQEASALGVHIEGVSLELVDFSGLRTRCQFIAFMPQWDFLDFLAAHAARYPNFSLRMRAEATGIIDDGGGIGGVIAATPEGPVEIRAKLVVAADGRGSVIRERAGLKPLELGAPMDVLWFRLSRKSSDGQGTLGYFERGRIFFMINRGEHWQCGYVIPKGALDSFKAAGFQAFQNRIGALTPWTAERTAELRGWDDIKLLTVQVDRLAQWYRRGLLCIGDAAHAMSPIGGVGVNLAIQDAVAAANILAPALRKGAVSIADLRKVQRRREFPARTTQRIQTIVQNRVVAPVLAGNGRLTPPRMIRMVSRVGFMRRMVGRMVGLGVRPEHIAGM
jgi:2-polyprenyl-6-methoxyphenol hydroxylase-like FAD-dependent oxidoreductase